MLRKELPLSVKHPWTISIPELSSLAVSWPLHIYVILLHDLIFVPCFSKSTYCSIELVSAFAGSVGGLPDVASSCRFAENDLSCVQMASGYLQNNNIFVYWAYIHN